MLALILVLLVEFTSFKQISSSLKCVDWTRWFQSPPEVSSFRVSFFYFPHPRHTTQASSPLPFSIANTTGSRGAYSGWSDCQTPGHSWGHFQFWAWSSCSGMHTGEWNVLGSGSSFLLSSTQLWWKVVPGLFSAQLHSLFSVNNQAWDHSSSCSLGHPRLWAGNNCIFSYSLSVLLPLAIVPFPCSWPIRWIWYN